MLVDNEQAQGHLVTTLFMYVIGAGIVMTTLS